MVISNRPCKKPINSRVEMAVLAVESNYRASEPPMRGFDAAPTALDLDDVGETENCSNPRCGHSGVDECITCGRQWSVLA